MNKLKGFLSEESLKVSGKTPEEVIYKCFKNYFSNPSDLLSEDSEIKKPKSLYVNGETSKFEIFYPWVKGNLSGVDSEIIIMLAWIYLYLYLNDKKYLENYMPRLNDILSYYYKFGNMSSETKKIYFENFKKKKYFDLFQHFNFLVNFGGLIDVFNLGQIQALINSGEKILNGKDLVKTKKVLISRMKINFILRKEREIKFFETKDLVTFNYSYNKKTNELDETRKRN